MQLPKLSHDIQEDIWLWANVCRFPTTFHARIKRSLSCPDATIIPYCGEWILQRPDGSYVVRGQ